MLSNIYTKSVTTKNEVEVAVEIKMMAIDAIKIENRIRRRADKIESLAKSIKELGMINPPAVTSDGRLIAGERRILAAKHLGQTTVEVRVLTFENAVDLVRAEMEENTERENFTKGEAQLAADRWAKAIAATQRIGRPSNLPESDKSDGPANRNSANSAEFSRTARETRAQAAKATGYSHDTLEKVKKIREIAEGKQSVPREARVAAQEAIADLDTNPNAKVAPKLQAVEKLMPKPRRPTREQRERTARTKRKAEQVEKDPLVEQERVKTEQARAMLRARQMSTIVAIRYLNNMRDHEALVQSFDRVDAQEITRLLPVAAESLDEFVKHWRSRAISE
jgi:ParB family chromosome partitioning protein